MSIVEAALALASWDEVQETADAPVIVLDSSQRAWFSNQGADLREYRRHNPRIIHLRTSFRMSHTGWDGAFSVRFVSQSKSRFSYDPRSEESATGVASLDLLVVDAVTEESGRCRASYSTDAP